LIRVKYYSLLLIILFLGALYAQAEVNELDKTEKSSRYTLLFSEFFKNAFSGLGIKSSFSQNERIFTGFDQGLALVTLIKLYDIYGDPKFLDYAVLVSDFVFTMLHDPRFALIGSFYDESRLFLSNYRNVVDNLFLTWGLNSLADRIPNEQQLLKKDFSDRANKIANQLDMFVDTDQFIESVRIDSPSGVLQFKTYHNLLSSFIILESENDQLSTYIPKVQEIFDFVTENLRGENGEIYTLFYSGFVDNLVLLKNMALYINVGLQLAEILNDDNYLNIIQPTIEYIRNNFADLGVTRGYFEAIKDGSVIQEAKSLFSHALLLISFLKLSNIGDETAYLDSIRIWDTIEKYFKIANQPRYFSTINRAGVQASPTIKMNDNLMILFALSRMPIISSVSFASIVDFRNLAVFNVTHQIPNLMQASISLFFGQQEIKIVNITGTGELTSTEIVTTLQRPNRHLEEQMFSIVLTTSNIRTDSLVNVFRIAAQTGIEFQPSQILLFAAVVLIIFVVAINRLNKIGTLITKTEE
jgi:hypothetical protein